MYNEIYKVYTFEELLEMLKKLEYLDYIRGGYNIRKFYVVSQESNQSHPVWVIELKIGQENIYE